MENVKGIITLIGTLAAGAVVGFLGAGISNSLNSGFNFESSDYLLFAFSAAIISSVCYNIAGRGK